MTPYAPDPWADQPMDAVDHRLLAVIRRSVEERDPMPEGMLDRIKFAMTVRALEAEVADLTSASLAGIVRMTDYERAGTVTFESSGVSIMVTIETRAGGGGRLLGWVTSQYADVELRERARSQSVRADAEGRFAFEGLESGTVHLVIRSSDPGARPVITPGFEI